MHCDIHSNVHLRGNVVAAGVSRKAKCADRRASPGAPAHGLDVDDQGNGTVTESRMCQLIREPELIEGRQFEVEFPDEGMEAYSVTCG